MSRDNLAKNCLECVYHRHCQIRLELEAFCEKHHHALFNNSSDFLKGEGNLMSKLAGMCDHRVTIKCHWSYCPTCRETRDHIGNMCLHCLRKEQSDA